MAVLLVFAVAASAYVLNECWGSGKTSHFKLLLRCITIITTVIPPELPIELSMAVTGQCLIWVCGVWFVVCGLWFVVCGLWFAVCGLWFVVCGLRFVVLYVGF